MDIELGVIPHESVYITEQVTALYKFLVAKHPKVIGSEFLGASIPRGSFDTKGVRNEDLTNLTFENDTFEAVLSFECLEHMPDFISGMKEVARVLKPGGRFMWSVPFRPDLESNLERASLNAIGEIIHHEPPEYHGDPISSEGCLCYNHFGWEVLEQVKNAGFTNSYAVPYWSKYFAYLGMEQFLFVAEK
jgi:SAM-dependent methyltransferase